MDNDTPYETPSVTDHGSLGDLTAATYISGHYDRTYHAGDPNPPDNLDSSRP